MLLDGEFDLSDWLIQLEIEEHNAHEHAHATYIGSKYMPNIKVERKFKDE